MRVLTIPWDRHKAYLRATGKGLWSADEDKHHSELSQRKKTISETLLYHFLPYLYPNTGKATTTNPPPQLKVPPIAN